MNIRSKRGEVVTLTVVAVCIVAGLIGMFAAQIPMIKGILGFKDQKVINTSTTEPVWLKGPDGKQYLATKETVLDTTTQVKQPLVERLKGWLIVLGILCFIFPALGIWLRQKAVIAYNDLKDETVKIVQSVQAARAKITDPVLKQVLNDAMDKTQNDSTKALVADIKTNGTITS